MSYYRGARFSNFDFGFGGVVEGRGATLHPNIYDNFFVDISLL
jgi:hypothetical protein